MRYAIGIDVGIKNLGLCVFDFATAKFVFWNNISLCPNGRYVPANNVAYVRECVARYRNFFEDAACVLVERQMRCNMRIVEAVLQTLFFDTCIIINPRSVKIHYGIGTKNYKLNKQRAVEWVTSFVQSNACAFEAGVTTAFKDGRKKDDLADSLLLVTYYLDTYSNQLSSVDFVLDEH